MIKELRLLGEKIYYSLPIQLVLNHLRRNHVLIICWAVLFAMISGNLGNYLGIPYLFLDPVYLNEVGFTSFFIVGIVIAGFSIAFYITTYITDSHRFSFIGAVSKPFTVFSLNNSIIPFVFFFLYVIYVIRYQFYNKSASYESLFENLAGLTSGYILMHLVLFTYFWFTNKDIFKYMVCKVDEKLKQNIKATRASAMKKLDIARKKQVRVEHYFNLDFEIKRSEEHKGFYDRNVIIQVFDQNHFNLVIIEFLIFSILLLMGIFKDYPIFQLPAAASFILFLSIFVMFSGAFSYWFGGWSATSALAIIIIFNSLVKKDLFNKRYEAFGLDYSGEPAPYTLNRINQLNEDTIRQKDRNHTLEILKNWRAKFPEEEKPKMIFICVSGGGQRAALWTFNALQEADSLTGGALMKNTMLITGASGGLIGAGYFRELTLRQKHGENVNRYDSQYRKNISNDNLNAIMFSLLMNDVFVGFQKFEYQQLKYEKDRGYSFEQQLNKNTNGMLNKPLHTYRDPEYKSEIPMMIMAPTIINDGRKLYISPHHVSYMMDVSKSREEKTSGIDFLRFFEEQGSDNLRFLSGLRMSATFPYITPNITLPSTPPLDIMDAGITDNFGISDATRFLFSFRKWIEANTSGVVFLSIRDSQKDGEVKEKTNLSLLERFSLPISSIYQNFESLQDITNDDKIAYARSWFHAPIDRVDIEYVPYEYAKENLPKMDSLRMENVRRASLSWRLTDREKKNLIINLHSNTNQKALRKLQDILK